MKHAQQEVINAAKVIRELRFQHPEDFGSYANDVHALDMLDVALAELDAATPLDVTHSTPENPDA